MKKIYILLLIVILALYMAKLFGQGHNEKVEFIDEIAPIAVALNQQDQEILPSVIIAQAILESNYGKSELAVNANNLWDERQVSWKVH
ncbi:glucosaminidase domain-containing protein [Lysinibacillus fusiformis]|nr:glucosaminidase domain-containing protein [Lysinibacillus fusiformis]